MRATRTSVLVSTAVLSALLNAAPPGEGHSAGHSSHAITGAAPLGAAGRAPVGASGAAPIGAAGPAPVGGVGSLVTAGIPAYRSAGGYASHYSDRNGFRSGNRPDRYRRGPAALYFGVPFYDFSPDYSSDFVGSPNDAYPPPDGPDPVTQGLMMHQDELGQQIERLTGEIEALKAQQNGVDGVPYALRPNPGTVPEAAAPPPIKLVLRDGKTLTVVNYALMNGVFWDFTSTPAKRIPVSNVNIAASRQATEEAGGDFPALGNPPPGE